MCLACAKGVGAQKRGWVGGRSFCAPVFWYGFPGSVVFLLFPIEDLIQVVVIKVSADLSHFNADGGIFFLFVTVFQNVVPFSG